MRIELFFYYDSFISYIQIACVKVKEFRWIRIVLLGSFIFNVLESIITETELSNICLYLWFVLENYFSKTISLYFWNITGSWAF